MEEFLRGRRSTDREASEEDIFESMVEFIIGCLKFYGGSQSLMPKKLIKVANMVHKHNVYTSTGDC
uniref:Uncharacterized protein n=1 Tax=Nelumbo nucifera TaxID=4432 RepID=A0A822Y0P6_NELNU|nr:TPA_asm: hypothetical protein HUJ06_024671 [Nelumbo nucifera]